MAARWKPQSARLDSVQKAGAFAFPGLWDRWMDREIGKPLHTFAIITTHANVLLRPIQDRMPVMYRRDIGRQCLEWAPSDDLELSLVTQPVLSEELEPYEVSTLVNSPENDSPECVRRVREQTRDAQLLFSKRRQV